MTGSINTENTNLPPDLLNRLLIFQQGEITEYYNYRKLAALEKSPHNREVILKMADEEYSHYRIWKRYTGKDPGPQWPRVWFYVIISKILGLTFGIKLMEKRENDAILTYREISPVIPEAEHILSQEAEHELAIISMLDEKGLRYVGSVVLGINDALVEFTGSLAGFTFALQETKIIAAVGFIMGIAAALSMGASEYLSQKSEVSANNPVTAAFYTGGAYLATVIFLILPFIFLTNPLKAYFITLSAALLIIVLFTFYTSVAKDLPFWKRFIEMAGISLGIAGISFAVGILIRMYFQVNV